MEIAIIHLKIKLKKRKENIDTKNENHYTFKNFFARKQSAETLVIIHYI